MGKEPVPFHIHPKKRWQLLSALTRLMDVNNRASQSLMKDQIRVPIKGLPSSFIGYRILHISDLHIREIGRKEMRLLSWLPQIDADLFVVTGDFAYQFGENFDITCKFVKKMLSVSKGGAWMGVRGNCDNPDLVHQLEALGVCFLGNQSRPLRRQGEQIVIGGVEDPHHRMDDVGKAFSGVPDDEVKLLLAHSPDVLLHLGEVCVDLILAGHSHGGQVCLPGLGPLITKTVIGREFAAGYFQYGGTRVHVSRGVGGIGFRLNCSPHITEIVLTSTE